MEEDHEVGGEGLEADGQEAEGEDGVAGFWGSGLGWVHFMYILMVGVVGLDGRGGWGSWPRGVGVRRQLWCRPGVVKYFGLVSGRRGCRCGG